MGRPQVLIVGGGFGGLYAAKALRDAPVDLTVVDRRNHHVFQPLLYQVATAGLSAIDIAEPIRRILRRDESATVLLGEVVEILEDRAVLATGMSIPFDFLIVAAGATHDYFGHPEWAAHAPGLKTLEDALSIRRRILDSFEQAELETDPARRTALLTFVIVGGGPTGAELAGAVAELARHTLAGDFRRIRTADARIVLLEAGPAVVPGYPPSLSRTARRQLERLGVEVQTGRAVTGISAGGVTVGDGRIEAHTVLWAAGVAASPLGAALGAPIDRAGRVVVEPDLSVPGRPNVFVVGDLAAVHQEGRPVPGVAPAAIQMGKHASASIRGIVERGERPAPFRYTDRGSMATLGRSAAVADIRGLRLSGLPAWLAWLLVHIVFLIGFRNRLVVLFEWAKAYLTYGRSARLILDRDPPDRPGPHAGPGAGRD